MRHISYKLFGDLNTLFRPIVRHLHEEAVCDMKNNEPSRNIRHLIALKITPLNNIITLHVKTNIDETNRPPRPR